MLRVCLENVRKEIHFMLESKVQILVSVIMLVRFSIADSLSRVMRVEDVFCITLVRKGKKEQMLQ